MLHSFECNWEALHSLEQPIDFFSKNKKLEEKKKKEKTSESSQLILGLKLLKYPVMSVFTYSLGSQSAFYISVH